MEMYAYWLSNTGLSVRKLEKIWGSSICARELYGMSEKALMGIEGLTDKDVEKITESKRNWDLQREWMKLQESGISFVSVENEAFPEKLRFIQTPPYALYYVGHLPQEGKKRVAIVGARTRSAYGSQMAEKLAKALAQNDVEVISGMALGIDADAHRGALDGGGSTYAVLGCGADRCYPRQNRYLYDKIPEKGGVLSEYAPETPPLAAYFPQRNRLIAGLSDYTVVIEARLKSGSLITADYAMEQGREVYALPGRVTDELSQGCNHLIQQGAGVVTGVEDFLKEIQLDTSNIASQLDFRKNLLEKDESLVYALLDFYPVGLGTLVEKTPFGLGELLPILERLKQKGFIRENLPNYFVKTI